MKTSTEAFRVNGEPVSNWGESSRYFEGCSEHPTARWCDWTAKSVDGR